MTEFLIYLAITIFSMALFYFWFKKSEYHAEKKWLMSQIAEADDSKQASLAKALQKLQSDHMQTNKSISTTLWISMIIAPATFAIDYIWFQDIPISERISIADVQNNQQEAPDLATAITQLEQKLAENPNDLDGQMLYGTTMMQLQRYEYAVGAFKKANELEPNNPHILTELAEAIAFKNNTGSFLGEPEEYLEQAIKANPNHQKAMWLQGIVYYENLQYEAAEKIWSDLIKQVESPNIKATITAQINQAREALNKNPLSNKESENTVNYFVVIDASDAVKKLNVTESARIFVYAKEVNGMPMPIAAVPISQPFKWPLSVNISDVNNLNPNRKLSSFDQVEFSAKLSLSGSATPNDTDINSDSVIGNIRSNNIQILIKQ